MKIENMKKIYLYISILITIPFLSTAQKSTYEYRPGYWTVGINGGLSYQSSDVKALLEGYGLGATVAKNIYYQPGAPLSFDLRGRALFARNYGLDVTRNFDIENNSVLNGTQGLDYTTYPADLEESSGFVFQNHKTDIGELALEGVITLNQLREKTGVVASLYGGVGVDWYRTSVDQADAAGNEYYAGYAGIDASKSSSNIQKELQNIILDGNYESLADGFANDAGKLGIMPSVGVELGYQVTPKFSIHAGHRMTFAGNNILDGQQWSDNGNDAYHYTNFGMRWIIEEEAPRQALPTIQITTPINDPYNTRDPNGIVRANIRNVNSAMDVTCRVNGQNNRFTFNNGRFSTNFRLRPGRNDVLITATNNAGDDSESVIIIFQDNVIDPPPPPPVVYAPQVEITRPNGRSTRVNDANYTVRAKIDHVNNRSAIDFRVNGYTESFTFDSRSGNFTANINLIEGRNDISITASNTRGTDKDEAFIILEDNVELPYVRITNPSSERTETEQSSFSVKADVRNVRSKNDITVKVNGYGTRRFNFYPDREYLRVDVDLQEGNNTIEIIAENEDGTASDQAYIIYETYEPVQPPTVQITYPDRENMTTTKADITIEAEVEHVERKSDITFSVNSRKITDFSYDSYSGQIRKRINLEEGNNNVVIRVKNQDGTDEDRVNIRLIEDISRKRPPVVRITSPANNSTVQTAEVDLTANIENITTRNNIAIFLNGNNFTNFSFNTQSKKLTANIPLVEGNNTIRVRARNADGSDEDQVNVKYQKQEAPTVYIQKPDNNATISTSTTTLIAKTENVANKSEITIVLNSSSFTNFRFDRNKQEINATIPVKEGYNSVRIRVRNDGGSDEASVKFNGKTSAPPTVNISSPRNNSTTEQARISLKATVKNVENRSGITLTLNGSTVSGFNFTSSNGNLTATLNLKEGNNSIRLRARNSDGSDEASVNVRYAKPQVAAPTVNITNPRSSSHTTQESTYTVRATVRGVDSKSNIKVTVNGSNTSSFSYNTSNGNVTTKVNLKEGNNTILIKATNDGGSAQDQATIRKTTAKPPVVRITSPASGTKVTQKSITIKGSLTNVTSKNQITFKVNGKTTSNFSFNGKVFSATVSNLQKGNNTFDLSAQNQDGRDQASTTVNYQPKPVGPKPVVSFVKPAKPRATISATKTTIIANVKNVLTKNDVTLWINGVKSTSFEYNSKLKQITANVALRRGNNSFKVEGKNEAGTATAETTLLYKISRKQPPVIEIQSVSQPTTNPFEPNVGKSTIKARILHIAGKGDVSLIVNGKKVSDFTFTPKTKQFQATITLSRGTNTIKIRAVNEDGSDEESRTIEY